MTTETPEPTSIEPTWLTLSQAETYLQVSRRTVYRLMEEGRLPYFRISGTRQRRFQKSDLDKLMIPEDPNTPVDENDEFKDIDD
ncbi:MAG: helix-turn-helix domain-containing protein [Chloroflexota bacterium]